MMINGGLYNRNQMKPTVHPLKSPQKLLSVSEFFLAFELVRLIVTTPKKRKEFNSFALKDCASRPSSLIQQSELIN